MGAGKRERELRRVAEEKRRMSLASGDSAAKADRYAREVMDQLKKGGKG